MRSSFGDKSVEVEDDVGGHGERGEVRVRVVVAVEFFGGFGIVGKCTNIF